MAEALGDGVAVTARVGDGVGVRDAVPGAEREGEGGLAEREGEAVGVPRLVLVPVPVAVGVLVPGGVAVHGAVRVAECVGERRALAVWERVREGLGVAVAGRLRLGDRLQVRVLPVHVAVSEPLLLLEAGDALGEAEPGERVPGSEAVGVGVRRWVGEGVGEGLWGGVRVPVGEGDGVGVGVGEAPRLGETERLRVAEAESVGVAGGDAVRDGLRDRVESVGEGGEGDRDPVREAVGVGVRGCEAEAERVTVRVGVSEGERLSEREGVGGRECVGVPEVGVRVRVGVHRRDAVCVGVGVLLGLQRPVAVPVAVAVAAGLREAVAVGVGKGEREPESDGDTAGVRDGVREGEAVADSERVDAEALWCVAAAVPDLEKKGKGGVGVGWEGGVHKGWPGGGRGACVRREEAGGGEPSGEDRHYIMR